MHVMGLGAMAFELRILAEPSAAHQTIHHHFPYLVYQPLVIPLLLQRMEVIAAKSASEPTHRRPQMAHLYMLIEHGFKVVGLTAIVARDRRILVVVVHVLGDHLLRVKLAVAHVALIESYAVYLLVL